MGDLAELLREQWIFTIVDRNNHQARPVFVERRLQRRGKVLALRHVVTVPAESTRKRFPVRIAESKVSVPPELIVLFPRDQPVFIVRPDQDDDVAADPLGRFHFLNIHQKSCIAGDRKNASLGKDDVRGDSAR